jgi:hypothetical protein
MPEVVEVHKHWHHLRVDDEGITIRWRSRADHIPWSEIGALAVDVPVSVLELAARGSSFSLVLRDPCLFVCVLHDGRPHPAMAVRFPLRGFRKARNTEREAAQVRALVGDWIDLHQVTCHFGYDVDEWWYAQPGARPSKKEHPTEPTVAERAARLHHEVEHMRTQLDHLRDER